MLEIHGDVTEAAKSVTSKYGRLFWRAISSAFAECDFGVAMMAKHDL
jgi:hypothetical protein